MHEAYREALAMQGNNFGVAEKVYSWEDPHEIVKHILEHQTRYIRSRKKL